MTIPVWLVIYMIGQVVLSWFAFIAAVLIFTRRDRPRNDERERQLENILDTVINDLEYSLNNDPRDDEVNNMSGDIKVARILLEYHQSRLGSSGAS